MKAIGVDRYLGGKFFDIRIVNFDMHACKRMTRGKDMTGNYRAFRRLRALCERAKRMFCPRLKRLSRSIHCRLQCSLLNL